MENGFRMFETKFQVLNINIEMVKKDDLRVVGVG